MPEANMVPFTAWEQAVFVVLFVVMVIVLLRWFSKQQGEWQKFIGQRDDQWQGFLESQREIDQNRYQGVNDSVENLTKVTSELVGEVQDMRSEFRAHDTMEREVLRGMKPKPIPKPISSPSLKGRGSKGAKSGD